MGFLTRDQLSELGLKKYGENVLISEKASVYNPGNITIGSNVRIDDFCILSAGEGGIEVGNYIHIACYTSLIGQGKITLKDYSNLSSKVAIYSSNDDYSGNWMTNPMVPDQFTNIFSASVSIGKHVIIGSGSVILPNIKINDGVAIGALSLVKNDCVENYIYAGNPAVQLKKRKSGYLALEKDLLKQ